tara:strand:+ start:561 stop:1187 length:627 start_codon:yes stop_codon:yes gene_type:complete
MIERLGVANIQHHWTDFEVFGDFHLRGCWWNAKRCWEYGLETGATHHLLLQDDVEVCRDFVTGVFDVIAAFPSEIISLFSFARKGFAGSAARWGEAEGPWGPAIVMEKSVIRDFLEWETTHIKPDCRHDDTRISLFCAARRQTVKVPFPNLVEHEQALKSIQGNAWNKPRVSIDFMGERSPHDFNWHDTSGLRRSVNSTSQHKKFLLE